MQAVTNFNLCAFTFKAEHMIKKSSMQAFYRELQNLVFCDKILVIKIKLFSLDKQKSSKSKILLILL